MSQRVKFLLKTGWARRMVEFSLARVVVEWGQLAFIVWNRNTGVGVGGGGDPLLFPHPSLSNRLGWPISRANALICFFHLENRKECI